MPGTIVEVFPKNGFLRTSTDETYQTFAQLGQLSLSQPIFQHTSEQSYIQLVASHKGCSPVLSTETTSA